MPHTRYNFLLGSGPKGEDSLQDPVVNFRLSVHTSICFSILHPLGLEGLWRASMASESPKKALEKFTGLLGATWGLKRAWEGFGRTLKPPKRVLERIDGHMEINLYPIYNVITFGFTTPYHLYIYCPASNHQKCTAAQRYR